MARAAHEAGPACGGTDFARLWCSTGTAASWVDGQCPAGVQARQSESDLEHPPGRVGRGTAALPTGRGTESTATDTPGLGRRSLFDGG